MGEGFYSPLTFGRTLVNTVAAEAEANPKLTGAKQAIGVLWLKMEAAEVEATTAEQRFAAAGDLVGRLLARDKLQ